MASLIPLRQLSAEKGLCLFCQPAETAALSEGRSGLSAALQDTLLSTLVSGKNERPQLVRQLLREKF